MHLCSNSACASLRLYFFLCSLLIEKFRLSASGVDNFRKFEALMVRVSYPSLAQHLHHFRESNHNKMTLSLIFSLFFFNIISVEVASTNVDKITIVVIEGKAFLADVDQNGKVVHKYMEIEGYEDEGDDLDKKIEEAKRKYLLIKEREKDQIRFIQYDYLDGAITGLGEDHLADLTQHYNNTYANQIVITLAKRSGNEAFLKEKEELLLQALHNLKVPREDIEIQYKWDMGPEPTQFIKVKTGLRELPST